MKKALSVMERRARNAYAWNPPRRRLRLPETPAMKKALDNLAAMLDEHLSKMPVKERDLRLAATKQTIRIAFLRHDVLALVATLRFVVAETTPPKSVLQGIDAILAEDTASLLKRRG